MAGHRGCPGQAARCPETGAFSQPSFSFDHLVYFFAVAVLGVQLGVEVGKKLHDVIALCDVEAAPASSGGDQPSARGPACVERRVEKLGRLLRDRFPDIALEVDAPSRASGDWFIDTKLKDQSFVIEFRPKLGFGLSSTPAEGIGEGPDEFLEDEEAVADRVAALLGSRAKTEPQRVRLLQELRERQQVSQISVADKLGVRQPTVSKIERREDVNVSTLRK